MQINGEASHDSSYNTKKEKMSMGTNSRLDFKTGSSDITHSGLIPIYEPGSGYFTIRMHHGGTFNFSQPTVYVGGSVLHCDYCSIKNLSFGLLDSTSKFLGYGSVASCVFTDPAVGLADGLTAIVDRGDMKELAKFGITHGFVDVYLVGTDGVGLHGAGTNYSLGFNDDVPAIRATSQLGNVPPSQAAKKGSRDDGKCPGPITSHSPKKENKRVQKKVQNNAMMDPSLKQYYNDVDRSMRHMRRIAKKQGQFKEYGRGPGPHTLLREVDGILYLDEEEQVSMDEEGPAVTQPTQAPQSDKATQPVADFGMVGKAENSRLGTNEYENDDEFLKAIDLSIQAKIDSEYEKNMSELEANLKDLQNNKGKGIAVEVQVQVSKNENMRCGIKRKNMEIEASDGLNFDEDGGNIVSDGERADGLDFDENGHDDNLGPRFDDSENEVDDESDFDEQLAASLGEAGTSRNVDEEENDPDWEDPGDDYKSDGLYSQSSSDSEAEKFGKQRVTKTLRFVKPRIDEDVVFQAGHLFISREEFQNACRHHGTVAKRRIRFGRSNPKRCTAYCTTSSDCHWMVSVNYRAQTACWELTKMIFHHTCATTFNHKCAGAKYLGERYKDEIRIMPNMSARQLIDKIQKDLHIIVSKDVAAKARKLALNSIEGDWKQQYIRMKEYCNELRRSNPGSTVVLQTEKNAANRELFRRVYVCFDACKKGFVEGCRPMIGMDGCHLTGPHKGILLAAIGLDANDQIFPIAYALVEIECSSSWLWFLTLLRKDLGIKNSKAWTLLTDKQKGLGNALHELFPEAEHRMCTWHLYKNFKGTYPSLELKEMLWAAAKSTHSNQYDRNMDRIKEANPAAYAWLKAKNPENWARAYFHVESKSDILVNNICECFNRVILHARDKPVLNMLDAIHFYFMDRLQKRRVFISRIRSPLGPKIAQKLEKSMRDSNLWVATHVGDLVFNVNNCYESKYEVRLEERICSCRKWQLTGIPCAHAVAAIGQTKEEPMAFMDPYYSKEMYCRAYKYIIYPVNGPELWDKVDELGLLPPKELKIGGRPPKARKKGAIEREELKNKNIKGEVEKASRVGKMNPYKCSECKQPGHTVKTCPTKRASSEPQPQPTPKSVPKKMKKAQVCSSCKKPGHNMITCPTAISARYKFPLNHSEPLEVQK